MLTTNAERHPPTAPIRTCVGCRRRGEQSELVRCVLGDDGSVHVSRTASGRGAWVCGAGCARTAIARRGFDRAWRTIVAPAALVSLIDELERASSLQPREHHMRDLKTTVKG